METRYAKDALKLGTESMMREKSAKSSLLKRLVIFTIGGVGVATCVAFLGRYWWVFELTSHFRMQYFLLLLGCSMVLLFRSNYKWAIVAGFFSLINLATVVPFWTEVHAESSPMRTEARSYRALLFNVNHSNHDSQRLITYIDSVNPDFIILLEVNERWMSHLQEMPEAFSYRKGISHEEYGILLLSKIPFDTATIHYFGKGKIPSIIAHYSAGDDLKFTLLGTHPRSPLTQKNAESRNEHLVKLGTFISRHNLPVILLGDLNTTPWSPVFQDFLVDSGLQNPAEGLVWQPTWPTLFPFAWIPIDHCLVSPSVFVHHKQVGPHIGSDHYPLIVEFSIFPDTKSLSIASAIAKK